MKKMLMVVLILLFLSSCNKENNVKLNEPGNTQSQLYDIESLDEYFCGKKANEFAIYNQAHTLHYIDVKSNFPIEVNTCDGYTVYKVEQGGYYFVFWSQRYMSASEYAENNPAVYFTAYFPYENDISKFESLQSAVSTAADVKNIDPYFELSFLMSSGIFSYSFLNTNEILEIEYLVDEQASGYDSLIVKSISVISRDIKSSMISLIADCYLPHDEK